MWASDQNLSNVWLCWSKLFNILTYKLDTLHIYGKGDWRLLKEKKPCPSPRGNNCENIKTTLTINNLAYSPELHGLFQIGTKW